MELALFIASHLVGLALIACAAFGVASLVLAPRKFSSPLEHVVVATALGLGIMGTLVFLLGILSALYWWPVFIGFVGMVAAGLRQARHIVKVPPRDGFRVLAVTLLAIVVLAPVVYAAMYPPTAIDALGQHLPAAKAYVQRHQVRPLPHLRFPVLPSLNEMLFTGALLLFDDVTAQLIEVLFLVLVLATVLAWAERLERPLTGLWTVGLLVGTPSLMLLASTAYVDVALTAFATLAFYSLHRHSDTDERRWMVLAGVFGGCAAGTKHSGLILLVILLAGVAAVAWKKKGRFAGLWPFAMGATAFGGPWYLWIAFWTGNPVWPFFGQVLGYGFWTAADVAWLDWSLRSYGWGRSFPSFLLLPWNLAFREPVGEPPLQPAPFVLLPVALWWAFRKRKGRALLFAIGAYLVFWFWTSQQVRFLLPVLPVLALMDSRALDELSARLRRSVPPWAGRLAAGAIFIGLSYPLFGLYRLTPLYGALPTTAPARDIFLRQRLPSYSVYRDLNSRFGPGYTIYAFRDDATKYYCDGTQIGDWFGPGRYGDVPLDNASRLFEFLRGLNADFLLVRSEPSAAALAAAPGSRELFESIPTSGDVKLFRLRGARH